MILPVTVIGSCVTHRSLIVKVLKINFDIKNSVSGGIIISFIKEFWIFMKVRKKFWLLPIMIMLVTLGGLLVLSQGTVIAPFIYTLF